MSDVEISLFHWPGAGGPVLVARSASPGVLRVVRDLLIQEAEERARLGSEVCGVSPAVLGSDVEALERRLRLLIPDHETPLM